LWDLAFAAILGLRMLVGGLVYSGFKPTAGYFIGGAAGTVALAAAAFVAQRWFGDRSKGDAYGEVVRTVDPEETAANLPYATTAVAGLVAALWCAIGAIVIGSISETEWAAVVSAVAVLLASYTLLAFVSLVVLTFKHQQHVARLKALEESTERVHRSASDG
jgi:hypothetical protein